MACGCVQCLRHREALGLADEPVSRQSIQSIRAAYLRLVKLSHPDRFENDPGRRVEAEERFKLLQVAYRELTEHQQAADESEAAAAPPAQDAPFDAASFAPKPRPPAIAFGNAKGCYVMPHFPPRAARIARDHLDAASFPIAIADLAGDGSLSRFLLLATHSVIVKDVLGNIALLWLDDMGSVELVSRVSTAELGLWQRIKQRFVPPGRSLVLSIFRRNGSPFCSLADEPEDDVKTAIYQYLQRRNAHPEDGK